MTHNLSLFFPRPPSSLYLCPSPGILNGLSRLCYSTHSARSSCCFQDQNPTESRALSLFFPSAGPGVHPAVSVRLKWGHNGFSRLCHITCFFMSTIWLRPRLSRALLLSLFSMPDKLLSGCRSFRFFPKNGLIPIFLCRFQLKKKPSFNGNSSLRKKRGSLKELSQSPQKRLKTLRTSSPQPRLDLSFLTAEIHQREC